VPPESGGRIPSTISMSVGLAGAVRAADRNRYLLDRQAHVVHGFDAGERLDHVYYFDDRRHELKVP
jgi:hypothetical protein